MKCVIPWMDALLSIQVLCDTIEYVEALQGNVSSKATGFHYFQINVIKLDFYKRIVYEFSKMINLRKYSIRYLKTLIALIGPLKKRIN